jgi:hypothetical protein
VQRNARVLVRHRPGFWRNDPSLIEHGDQAADEHLEMMRDKGIFFDITPTWWNGFLAKTFEADIAVSPALKSRMAAVKDKRLPRDISFTQRILKSG